MDRKPNDQGQSKKNSGPNRNDNQRGRQFGQNRPSPSSNRGGRGGQRDGQGDQQRGRPFTNRGRGRRSGGAGASASGSGGGSKAIGALPRAPVVAREPRKTQEEDLNDFLSNVDLSNSAICLRPSFKSGINGREVKVATNFFRMNVKGDTAYRYLVEFTYSPDQRGVGQALHKRNKQKALVTFIETAGNQLFEPIKAGYAYDGDRILYTYKPLKDLPEGGQTFSFEFIEFEGAEPKMVDINLKTNGSIYLVPNLVFNEKKGFLRNPDVLQALDVICKKAAFQTHIAFGSRIFVGEKVRNRVQLEIRDRKTIYDLAFGHHQSTRLCQGGVMMNIDRSTAVLYRGGPLIEAMATLLKQDLGRKDYCYDDRAWRILNEFNRLRVQTNYREYSSKLGIKSFTRSTCERTFFKFEGKDVSVSDYFKSQYKKVLKYPYLPCITYGDKKYIPVELCTLLPDQRKQDKLREDLLRVASGFTTSQRPDRRASEIVEEARRAGAQNVLESFNIKVAPEHVTVQARVLNAPKLEYGQGPFTPVNGDWQMYANPKIKTDKQKTLVKPIHITKWMLLIMSRKINEIVTKGFVECFITTAQALGIKIENPMNPYKQLNPSLLQKELEACAKQKPQLIVIIMSKGDAYNDIKSYCDRDIGIPTQVVDERHYDAYRRKNFKPQKIMDPAYHINLFLKINTKLGGINTKLTTDSVASCSILENRTMVVGIDVNHPSPSEHTPSIAAVVGSIDKDFVKYRTEIRVNPERLELVPVAEMMKPILEAYKEAQGFYPNHIQIYRDGVGEGFFRRVMDEEIDPLRELLKGYKNVTFTYIVVSKRHNTRFFPMDKNQTSSGNILPGSVIDTDICHYKLFDFYLCSQNSLLGTARPNKYTVLWNSSKALADDLQIATYYLCYLFARATKSISDPAPARYAHHAASRGKLYLNEMIRNDFKGDYGGLIQHLNKKINVENDLRKILYYV